jgi:hypothetical protein
MVLVAIAAVVLGADSVRRRRDRWRDLGFTHSMKERLNLHLADGHAQVAAQNEAGAEGLRASAAAAHGDGTINEEMRSSFADTFAAAARKERAGERRYRALARYHVELRRKYERAARYPWLPVAPDPPEPRDTP